MSAIKSKGEILVLFVTMGGLYLHSENKLRVKMSMLNRELLLRPLPVYVLFCFGLFSFLEISIWLKYIGIPRVIQGEYYFLTLITLISIHITIFIGSVLMIFKNKHAIILYSASVVLSFLAMLKLFFFGPSDDMFLAQRPESIAIVVASVFYCIDLKNKKYFNN